MKSDYTAPREKASDVITRALERLTEVVGKLTMKAPDVKFAPEIHVPTQVAVPPPEIHIHPSKVVDYEILSRDADGFIKTFRAKVQSHV